MLGGDPVLVALVDSCPEPLGQRLHGRAVAQVLEPLAGGDPDALLLLANVGHSVKTPAPRAGRW